MITGTNKIQVLTKACSVIPYVDILPCSYIPVT